MQQVTQTTDALSSLGVVEDSAFSLVLLPHQFDAWISQHADFVPQCQRGVQWSCSDLAEFEDISTYDEVQSFIVSEVCRRYTPSEAYGGVLSLPGRVGFVFGWLSAFASVRRDLALLGLNFLSFSPLVLSQCREEYQRGFNPLVAIPGVCQFRR